MHLRSATGASSGTESSCLLTGNDSPVRAASSICRPLTSTRRASAGTLSPEASATTSPGTISPEETEVHEPSLRTTTSSGTISIRASMARLARYSCTYPMTALSTTTAKTTMESAPLPRSTARVREPRSTYISGSFIWRQRILRAPPREPRARTLGPASSSRLLASAASKPFSAETSSSSRLPRAARECGGEAPRFASAPAGVEFVTVRSPPDRAACSLPHPGAFAPRAPALGASALWVSADHQHGPVRVAQHLLGDAPDQGMLQPGHAFGAQDYGVGTQLLGHLEDRLIRLAVDDQLLAFHAGLLRQR